MKRAAIYARCSSENQRKESIDDQIASCRKYAALRKYEVDDSNVFTDEATSGARADRKGLDALLAASEAGRFEVVLIDDLSRLARDNYLMLTKLAQLHFNGVSVVSVADGLDTDDRDSKLAIQIRGIFNELQLEDLRRKRYAGRKARRNAASSWGNRRMDIGRFPLVRQGWTRKAGPDQRDTRWK